MTEEETVIYKNYTDYINNLFVYVVHAEKQDHYLSFIFSKDMFEKRISDKRYRSNLRQTELTMFAEIVTQFSIYEFKVIKGRHILNKSNTLKLFDIASPKYFDEVHAAVKELYRAASPSFEEG